MATKPKTTAGHMACACCGQRIPVKAAENGTLNASCAWCDFSAYAKNGTEAHRIITSKLTGTPAAAAVAKPAATTAQAAPVTTPAPTAAPRRPAASVFHLGG